MTGRVGKYEVGVLNIVSNRARAAQGTAEAHRVPRTNYGAIRLKRDLGARSSIGVMYLDKSVGGTTDYNRTFGVATDLFFSPTLALRSGVGKTFDPDLRHHDVAQSHEVRQFTADYHVVLRYLDIGRNFNPEMGFVRRRDYRRYSPHVGLTPRINRGWLRELGIENTFTYESDASGNLTGRSYLHEFSAFSQHGDRATFEVRHRFERVRPGDQDIQGITLTPGNHKFLTYRAEGDFSDGRRVSGLVGATWGDFFDGTQRSFRVEATFRAFRRVTLEARFTQDRLRFPQESVITNVITNRFLVSLTPDLFFKAFTQWNDTERRVSVNLLIRYSFRPGSEAFLVYNEFYEDDTLDGLAERRWRIKTRTAAVKLQYNL